MSYPDDDDDFEKNDALCEHSQKQECFEKKIVTKFSCKNQIELTNEVRSTIQRDRKRERERMTKKSIEKKKITHTHKHAGF